MQNKELLRKIYDENKAMNRNMQRLLNIGLLGILSELAKEAKESGDPKEKRLVKAGLLLVAITQGLLTISDVMDFCKARRGE